MSLFNEILAPRYNSVLHKLLSMKEGAPAPQLSSDIQAGITLESDRPEWAYLAGEMLCGQAAVKGADVANFSCIALENPQGRNALCTVDGIYIANENAVAAGFWIILNPTTSLTGAINGLARDNRWTAPLAVAGTRGSCRVGSFFAAALTGDLSFPIWLPSNGSIFLPCSYVMAPAIPGQAARVGVAGRAINTAVTVGYFWRERILDPSESR